MEPPGWDWQGITGLVAAVGVIVIGLGQIWQKRQANRVELSGARVEATGANTNLAVNNVAAGQPNLITMVAEAHMVAQAAHSDTSALMDLVAGQVNATDGVRGCVDDLKQAQDEATEKLDQHIVKLDNHIDESEDMKQLLEDRIAEVRAREEEGLGA